MGRNKIPGLVVHALDVGLKLLRLNPPLAAAPDLDRGKLPRSNEGIGLGSRDIQGFGHVCQGQEAFTHVVIVSKFDGERNDLWITIRILVPGRVILSR
jgi:hypothetical protein